MSQDKQVRIVLGGVLGKRFRPEWNLYLNNPSVSEAVRAIDANTKGEFRRYLGTGAGSKRFYKVAVARKDNLLGADELKNPTGEGDIYILPTVKGSESGWAKVIVGALLVVATYGAAAGWFGGSLVTGMAAFGHAGAIAGFSLGGSMILGGIVQLLTPVPSFNQNSEGDSRGSNIFEGNSSTVSQGGAVGLVYGRMMVTPMPVSVSYTAYDRTMINSFAPGSYTIITDDNGMTDYVPDFPPETDNLPDWTG